MADTVRTRSALQTILADNTTFATTPQNIRDFLVSVLDILPITTQTSTYVMTTDDGIVFAGASGGAFAVTLPSVSTVAGRLFMVVKTDSSVNAVTITGTVSGVVNPTLTYQNSFIIITSDGTSYYRVTEVSSDPTLGGNSASTTMAPSQSAVLASLTGGLSTAMAQKQFIL